MATRNHPCRWTCKSTRHLAEELQRQGYRIGDPKIAALLRQMGYSLQANAKIIQGGRHLDRNAQFAYVNAQTKKFLAQGLPVISVDKKKELVGNYSHRGQEWQPQGEPEKTLIHDFPDQERGQAIPYGIYAVGRNQGWVSVGIDHDTAQFAIDSILGWWRYMGGKAYPKATELLILADAGGQQCQSVATVEGRPTAFSRSHWRAHPCVAFSARNHGIGQTQRPHRSLEFRMFLGSSLIVARRYCASTVRLRPKTT